MVAADFPFLGACYGIGTLGTLEGGAGRPDVRRADRPGHASTLTDDGSRDPLFGGLPATFDAFLGHKEAVSRLPARGRAARGIGPLPGAGVPARNNVYATQFHPELDVESLCLRIEIYRTTATSTRPRRPRS